MDLHVLRGPKHVSTIFGVMSVCVCVCGKIFAARTNAQDFTKLYIELYPNINWCLSTFRKNRNTGGAAVPLFPEFLG